MKNKICIVIIFLFSFHVSAQNIFRTVCQGKTNRLDSLLQTTSIDKKDNRGRSLLHWAIACKQKETFQLLIEKGIDINAEDHQKRTAMDVAVHFNKEDYFDTLIKLQKDNSWIDTYGTALLQKAVLNKSDLFVKKLVELGVDVNQENSRGSTALEIAKRIDADQIYTLLVSLGANKDKVRNMTLKGSYMGQEPPGTSAKLFAPNFISTEESEFGSVFNKDGTVFYFGVDVNGKNEIRYSTKVNDTWSKPQIFLSHETYGYNDPFLSNDENRLYFISNSALDGEGDPKDIDIWYVEKRNGKWSEPINAGTNINSGGNEYYISFTNDGTMYFSSNGNASPENKGSNYDIYYSKFNNGTFQKSVALGAAINSTAYEADVCIAPDESYIIFCSTRENSIGQGDLYISFKKEDATWTKSVNMGPEVNTKNYEYCPFITKDGKYLFYTSNQDIYWISTEIIKQLKKKNLE
ncbi:ankyrin repeat domain-containing protein [Aquimarina sp. D1M17]|uniref:ankyrin repeat domain-containing protein n=1 Tax=Aquimarina acroporae TaxID=2937283 RepID=UPI0020BE6E9C|nr:ankyrin repeat domain-containing protein [Aquimarina acroporae]MCK8521043.1 ankyrin repeat domain-containing protein [Aquimarina acroporae]